MNSAPRASSQRQPLLATPGSGLESRAVLLLALLHQGQRIDELELGEEPAPRLERFAQTREATSAKF